jgi:hypothetical protein
MRQPGWSRRTARRRLAWTLALALWLPLTQALAWAHTFVHHPQRADSSLAGQFDASCATCLAAAPLHGGALPSAQPQIAPPAVVQPPPQARAIAAHHHSDTLAYRSRAPPQALT